VAWTAPFTPWETSPDDPRIQALAYGAGRWVAAGYFPYGDRVSNTLPRGAMYSDDDGATWTIVATPFEGTNTWPTEWLGAHGSSGPDAVAYDGAGHWMMAGQHNSVVTGGLAVSTDGIHWTALATPPAPGVDANTVFWDSVFGWVVTVGGNSTPAVWHSGDGGATWTLFGGGVLTSTTGFARIGGTLVAGGGFDTSVGAYSTDGGATWTAYTTANFIGPDGVTPIQTLNDLTNLASDGTRLLGIVSGFATNFTIGLNGEAFTTTDGITWHDALFPGSNGVGYTSLVAVVWTGSLFVGQLRLSANPGYPILSATSPDGLTWTVSPAAMVGSLPDGDAAVPFDPGRAVHWNGALAMIIVHNPESERGATLALATSPDGTTWTTHYLPQHYDWGGIYSEVSIGDSVVWGAGSWLVGGTSSFGGDSFALRSSDGLTWELVTTPFERHYGAAAVTPATFDHGTGVGSNELGPITLRVPAGAQHGLLMEVAVHGGATVTSISDDGGNNWQRGTGSASADVNLELWGAFLRFPVTEVTVVLSGTTDGACVRIQDWTDFDPINFTDGRQAAANGTSAAPDSGNITSLSGFFNGCLVFGSVAVAGTPGVNSLGEDDGNLGNPGWPPLISPGGVIALLTTAETAAFSPVHTRAVLTASVDWAALIWLAPSLICQYISAVGHNPVTGTWMCAVQPNNGTAPGQARPRVLTAPDLSGTWTAHLGPALSPFSTVAITQLLADPVTGRWYALTPTVPLSPILYSDDDGFSWNTITVPLDTVTALV
jgi:hypothetical protein